MSFAGVESLPFMIDLKPACAEMVSLLRGTPDERLGGATPCSEYTVAELIEHVEEVARGFAATALKGDAPPHAGGIPRTGWRDAAADAVTRLGVAWDSPSAWEGIASIEPRLANEVWGRIACTEIVVHGWDLARATGQGFALPDETLRACLAHVADFVPKAPIPELWGPPMDVPTGAPLIDRIVAITGRDPNWADDRT